MKMNPGLRRRLGLCVLPALFAWTSAAGQPRGGGSDREQVERGLMGVELSDVFQHPRTGLQAPEGVKVMKVVRGLPADEAGIVPGDIILEIEGEPMRTTRQLQLKISQYPPEAVVNVLFLRGDQRYRVALRLGDWFDFLLRTPNFGSFVFDVRLEALTPELRTRFEIEAAVSGVVVSGFDEQSLFAMLLNPGSVIQTVNGMAVSVPDEVGRLLTEGINRLLVWENGVTAVVVIRGN